MAQMCQKSGCHADATHAIQLGIPTITDPDEAMPTTRVLMGVVVCEDHLEEATAESFLEINGDTIKPLVTLNMAPAHPDFDRAVILGVPVNSAEYGALQLQRMGLN